MNEDLKKYVIEMAMEKESGWFKEGLAGAKAIARKASKPSGKRIKHVGAKKHVNTKTGKTYKTSGEAATAATKEGNKKRFGERTSGMKGAKPISTLKTSPKKAKATPKKAKATPESTESKKTTHAERRGSDYKKMHGYRRNEAKNLKGKLKGAHNATKVVAGAGALASGGAYLHGKRKGEQYDEFA